MICETLLSNPNLSYCPPKVYKCAQNFQGYIYQKKCLEYYQNTAPLFTKVNKYSWSLRAYETALNQDFFTPFKHKKVIKLGTAYLFRRNS